jgi:hypothetical protein
LLYNVIRNAKNSALYDLVIVLYGDLCWNIFIEENVISACLALQNILISCPYCYIVYGMVYKQNSVQKKIGVTVFLFQLFEAIRHFRVNLAGMVAIVTNFVLSKLT